MFSSPASAGEPSGYDFQKEENAAKWKGVFVNSLPKVLEQVHPSLEARQDALEYVESLILRILGLLCGHPPPQTLQDIEERVRRLFPTPIDKWALRDARDAVEKGKKKSPLVLPVDKIHQLLQKEVLQHKIDWHFSLFVVAVLEYIAADIFKLAGKYVKNICHIEITCEDVRVSMYADVALMDMFYQDNCTQAIASKEGPQSGLGAIISQTYEESVRDLIHDERHYIRDLHMIIKVFREEIAKLTQDKSELDTIFSNIIEIYELTATLLSSLEDIMEITEEKQTPTIGSCFEELAEAAEFDVYRKYARDISVIINPTNREILMSILSEPEINAALRAAGHGFKEAVKYYLPKLLMQPIWHCFLYFDYIKVLHERTPNVEDGESLEQVEVMLSPVKVELEGIVSSFSKKDTCLPMQSRARKQAALVKICELQKTVEGWDQRDIGQCCNEFIREDMLGKVASNGRRLTERKALLFDGLLVLCKPSGGKRVSVTVAANIVAVGVGAHPVHQGELRLKERFFIRKVDIIDREDTEELKNAFEIAPRDHSNVILVAKSVEDKNNWMADLVMLNTKSMLERTLDSILLDEEKKHPLKLPPSHLYKFAEQDSTENIVLEARGNGGVPLIKGATLIKLVERLTYHIYADPAFVRTFLTTYRSFCSPQELLTLLIDRFDIPDPSLVYGEEEKPSVCKTAREDWKRYKKEFCQPVQFRVLNVLRHWVDHHFYDFERDRNLLERLQSFLDTISGKSMRKWVDSVLKIVQRKCEPSEQRPITFSFFERSPPPIEWHLKVPEEEYGILTLHPIELARQLTLLEFDLYRMVKSSELVGSVWTKKDKEKTSPNLLKMIKHTTNFTRWLQKIIVDTENFEERLAIVLRATEIMMVLQDLNNFNGVLAVSSALHSAAVDRLKLTFAQISARFEKALEQGKELNSNHFRIYQEKLRSINPPCVPFFGMYLTHILHIEEGNPDYLPGNPELINFSKRRRVAEITGEIQQYQNQPYCLEVEPRIRQFIANLCPFEPNMSENDISNYLFAKSLEIEPRGCKQPPRFPRKWPDLNLKSPGIKARSLSGRLPAPLCTLGSSVRLHDPPTEAPPPPELPETPPHVLQSTNSHIGEHSVCTSFLGELPPGSPSPSSMSIAPSNSSPQSPKHNPSSHFQQSNHFHSGTLGMMSALTGLSLSGGSPSAIPITLPCSINAPPKAPPLPPRIRRKENSISESPQQARQAPNAPALPPRDDISPPPLPPRKDMPPITLPPRLSTTTLNPSGSASLTRRNSTLENTSCIVVHTRRHMSFNGPSPTKLPPAQPNGSVTPRLPPKPLPGRPPSTTIFNFNAPPGSS